MRGGKFLEALPVNNYVEGRRYGILSGLGSCAKRFLMRFLAKFVSNAYAGHPAATSARVQGNPHSSALLENAHANIQNATLDSQYVQVPLVLHHGVNFRLTSPTTPLISYLPPMHCARLVKAAPLHREAEEREHY